MLPKIFNKSKNGQIVGLAPMDGVTDSAFRQIVKKYGDPDIMFTEFEHVSAILNSPNKVLKTLYYDEIERPIIAQIYGNNLDQFYYVSKLVCALGFDGIDINMGCPAKNVVNSGSGAGLIKTPDLAVAIVKAVKQGVSDWVETQKIDNEKFKHFDFIEEEIKRKKTKETEKLVNNINKFNSQGWYGLNNLHCKEKFCIPVSVKTRLGYDELVTESWISKISTGDPDWITVHGRTLKQMYAPVANWDEIAKAVKCTNIPILANGDVNSIDDFNKILEKTNAYGVLIGRASFGNPWIFKEIKTQSKVNVLFIERLRVLLEQAEKFVSIYGSTFFVSLRKHFGWYINGFQGAKELREKLMKISNLEDLKNELNKFII